MRPALSIRLLAPVVVATVLGAAASLDGALLRRGQLRAAHHGALAGRDGLHRRRVGADGDLVSVFNQIRGLEEAAPMPDSPHDHLATAGQQLPDTRRSAEGLDVLVRGGDPTAPRGAR